MSLHKPWTVFLLNLRAYSCLCWIALSPHTNETPHGSFNLFYMHQIVQAIGKSGSLPGWLSATYISFAHSETLKMPLSLTKRLPQARSSRFARPWGPNCYHTLRVFWSWPPLPKLMYLLTYVPWASHSWIWSSIFSTGLFEIFCVTTTKQGHL